MHSDKTRNKEKNNIRKSGANNHLNLEAVGEKCNISNNSSESYSTEFKSISSFTHESYEKGSPNDDIKERLLKKINSKLQDVILGLKIYDKQQTGKILSVNLYNVLRIFCFPLTLKEFNYVLKEESLDENGLLSYKAFLNKYAVDERRINSLWMNKENWSGISSLNIEDLELKIKNKIGRNIKNFVRCMWLHDFNNDGLIQKEDLKSVLENICFPIPDEQFNRFWNLYDPNNSGIINYKDFLIKLGTHTESYKRIMPQSKKNYSSFLVPHNTKYSRNEQIQLLCAKLGKDDPAVQGQIFNRILDIFKERVKKEFPLLMRTLQIKDSGGSGYVHTSVFHQVLNYFVMPTSYQLYKEILRSFNISPNNTRIPWYSFLKKVSVNSDVKCDQENLPVEGSFSWKICKSVLERLKRNGKNEDNFFKSAFTIPAQNHKKAVTRAELKKVINQCLALPVSEEEFKSMMFVLDPGHTNLIDCDKFLSLFKFVNERKISENSNLFEEDLDESKVHNVELRGENLKKSFKKCFNKNFKTIEKALFAFDSEETGTIKIDDFRKILDVFCFLLTDRQFLELIEGFSVSNKIFYGDFINFYRKTSYEDEEKWKSSVKRLMSTKVTPKQSLSMEDIMKSVQDIIFSNRDYLLQEFQVYDLCNTESVRKEVFFKLLQKYAFRLTDEQFQALWEKLPKNEIGFLKYRELLNEWCTAPLFGVQCDIKTASSSRRNSLTSVTSKQSSKSCHNSKERPKTASSVLSIKSRAVKVNNRPKSAASISNCSSSNLSIQSNSHLPVQSKKLENCGVLTKEQYQQFKSLDFGKIENLSRPPSNTMSNSYDKINETQRRDKRSHPNEYESIIKTRWRDILRRFKSIDHENHDVVLWNDFLSVLQKTGIDTSHDTIKSLENKYNIKKNSPVNYWIFLKKFLIKLNSEQNFKTMDKDWSSKQKVSGHESIGLCKVLLNHREKILKNYRDLYYAFRRADTQHTGELNTLEFRKILTFHKIYMTDHDLFYIQDYFDPKLKEKIPYDKFLKSFNKS